MKSNVFFAVFLLFIGFLATGFYGGDDLILWQSHRPLKWADFKAKAPQNTEHAALTNSGISLDLSGDVHGYTIDIKAHFVKNKSWSQRDSESDFLLKHEQLHFDITELFARKLRKKIIHGRWLDPEELNKAIQPLYDDNRVEWKAFQAKYDAETNHSINKEAQAEWNKLVSDSLKAYGKYRGQTVTIEF